MSQLALKVQDLSKQFRQTKALDKLSFSLPEGKICAFVGANGAGKTTTFSIIGGFLRADSGEIQVMGEPIKQLVGARGKVGILPQDMLFFDERSISNQLHLFARLAGFSKSKSLNEVERVLSAVGLTEKAKEKPGELSRGMRVRLGVAQALIGSPPILLLDEPLAGLDPMARSQIKELIISLSGDTTIMVSSHELGELQTFCNYICAIDRGRALFIGEMNEVLVSGDEHLEFHLGKPLLETKELEDLLTPHKVTAEEEILKVQFGNASPTDLNKQVLRWLIERDHPIVEVRYRKSLEEAYLQFLK